MAPDTVFQPMVADEAVSFEHVKLDGGGGRVKHETDVLSPVLELLVARALRL